MFTSLLIALTIPLIAAARRQSWSANVMPLIVFAALAAAYIGGQYLDGTAPALTPEYLGGFALALASQQGAHRMVKGMPWFQALESIGNPRGLAAQPRVGDKTWQ